MTGWLTANLVEELQELIKAGKSPASHLANLREATLPGLLEYGCARWRFRDLPALPPSITNSPLGLSLRGVRAELGLRNDGEWRKAAKTVVAQPHEFYVLEGPEPTLEPSWDAFLVRLRASARAAGFSSDRDLALAAAVGEMAVSTITQISPFVIS